MKKFLFILLLALIVFVIGCDGNNYITNNNDTYCPQYRKGKFDGRYKKDCDYVCHTSQIPHKQKIDCKSCHVY